MRDRMLIRGFQLAAAGVACSDGFLCTCWKVLHQFRFRVVVVVVFCSSCHLSITEIIQNRNEFGNRISRRPPLCLSLYLIERALSEQQGPVVERYSSSLLPCFVTVVAKSCEGLLGHAVGSYRRENSPNL